MTGPGRTVSATAADGAVDRVDEWGMESFPASDPPSAWQGPDEPPAAPPSAPPDR